MKSLRVLLCPALLLLLTGPALADNTITVSATAVGTTITVTGSITLDCGYSIPCGTTVTLQLFQNGCAVTNGTASIVAGNKIQGTINPACCLAGTYDLTGSVIVVDSCMGQHTLSAVTTVVVGSICGSE
jgi:hypothetical protein